MGRTGERINHDCVNSDINYAVRLARTGEGHCEMIAERRRVTVRFLPSNYIGSGALSKSLNTVSEKDTRLVPEDNQNPFDFVHLIHT